MCSWPGLGIIYIYIYIYIFLINIPESMSSNIKQIVMQLLKSMYGVPLKWEAHGPTVQWCEACIPPTAELRLLRKGVVLDLNDYDRDQAEWSRWLPATAPNAGGVMQGQMPSLMQKSLWLTLAWRDVYANVRSLVWGLGITGYGHQWWKPRLNRCVKQYALRARLPEALVDSWYKEGREHASLIQADATLQHE